MGWFLRRRLGERRQLISRAYSTNALGGVALGMLLGPVTRSRLVWVRASPRTHAHLAECEAAGILVPWVSGSQEYEL